MYSTSKGIIMNWIKNAYVKLRGQDFQQPAAVAFDGAWLHVAKDAEAVETYPQSDVEVVRWRDEQPNESALTA